MADTPRAALRQLFEAASNLSDKIEFDIDSPEAASAAERMDRAMEKAQRVLSENEEFSNFNEHTKGPRRG